MSDATRQTNQHLVAIDDALRTIHNTMSVVGRRITALEDDADAAAIYYWIARHPDEALSAMDSAYKDWDASQPEQWSGLLMDYLQEAMEKCP